jgi:hypothetical protein
VAVAVVVAVEGVIVAAAAAELVAAVPMYAHV